MAIDKTKIKNYATPHNKGNGGGGTTYVRGAVSNADLPADLNVTTITAAKGDINILNGSSLNFDEGQFLYIGSQNGQVVKISGSELHYETGNINNFTADKIKAGKIEADEISAPQGWLDTLSSKSITTDYLTVTRQAHFFELIIDKVRSVGGTMLMTQAQCVVDYAKAVDANGNYLSNLADQNAKYYDVFWLAQEDNGREVTNDWAVNDQAYCQSFNNFTGPQTAYNVSNKYYWRLVTAKLGDRYMNLNTGAELSLEQASQATVNSVGIEYPCLVVLDDDDNEVEVATGWTVTAQDIIPGVTWTPDSSIVDGRTKGIMNTVNTVFGIQMTPAADSLLSKATPIKFKVGCTNPARLNIGIYYIDGSSNWFTAPENAISSYEYSLTTNTQVEQVVITNADEVEWKLVHGIRLSNTDCDQTSVPNTKSIPSIGDNIAQLGYRWQGEHDSNEKARGNAIIIAAYNTPDKGTGISGDRNQYAITPPSYAQYEAIASDPNHRFDLAYYRKTYMDAKASKFVGELYVSTGQDIEDIMDIINDLPQGTQGPQGASGQSGQQGPQGNNGQNGQQGAQGAGGQNGQQGPQGAGGQNGAQGAVGDDAEFYRLEPIIEKAIVDKNGTLGVQLAYKIQHVVGDTITDVRASSNGYHVIFKGDNESSNTQLSVNTTQPSYTNTSYMTDYHNASSKPIYFTIYLVDGSNATQDQRIITVIFAAGATLQITDQINATVQGHQTAIVNLDSELAGTHAQVVTNTNNISNINQKADSIQSTVASQQTTINELTGEVEAQTSSISQITQTANNISMMVSENSGNVLYNSDFSDLNSNNKPNDWSTVTGGSLNAGSTSNKYLGYNSWYQNYNTWHSSNPSLTDCEMLQQTLHSTDGTINKILPDTIYELSFYAKGNGTLKTFIFPSCVDANIKAFVDGVEQTIPVDGNINWTLTSSYKFHRLVFRTTSTISGGQYILFRLATSNNYAYVVLPQLKGGADAGLRKTGIDIAKGTIDLRADRVKFSNSAGTVSGKVWIDSTAGTLHAVDGDFSGKIAASSGSIGGFTIGSDKLYNESFDAGIDIDTNNGMHAKIGKNAAGPMSTETAIMRAENTRSGQNYNTALYLNTSGANYNYAFYGNGNGVLDGLMFGFRTQYTQIPYGSTDVTASINLQDGSHIILYGSHTSGNVTMNMPTLGSICNCLGIPFGAAPTKSFAIEIDILNLSGYGHLYIGFSDSNTPGSSSTVLPVLFDNDGNVHYSKQLAQHDFYKVLLLYNANVKYRAYEIVYKT